jgi:serine/threonine protein phosphatase PrpC
VSDAVDAEPGTAAPTATAGPTVAFGFNRGKIPDQGEDSDPILRGGRDLALVGVFDGMGGAGGTVYETPEGPRTGAYLASRIARDVVEALMVERLDPQWRLDGPATAEDLRSAVKSALVSRLEELDAPKSGLRSKLLRALPTTMALVALQRRASGSDRWIAHVFWAGDSRAYVLESEGARQMTTDDLRDPGDAMANLRHDSVVANAMSADTEFHVTYRKVELRAPFIVVGATDGCYGYLRSPMHFEHLLLSHLLDAEDAASWSTAVQADIAAVTGDDAAMATLAIGADLEDLKVLYRSRVEVLRDDLLRPIDEGAEAVAHAEAALAAAKAKEAEAMAAGWERYKPGYERYLTEARIEADGDDEQDSDDTDLQDLLERTP